MTNHFSPNSDDRYWGQDRYHKYDAPLNPIVARQKPWKVTLDPDNAMFKAQKDLALKQYQSALSKYLRAATATKKKVPPHLEKQPPLKTFFQGGVWSKLDSIPDFVYRYE
jgi:hypothetical protein